MSKLYVYNISLNIAKPTAHPYIVNDQGCRNTLHLMGDNYSFISFPGINEDIDCMMYETDKNAIIEISLSSNSEKKYGDPNRVPEVLRLLATDYLHKLIEDTLLYIVGFSYVTIDDAIRKLKIEDSDTSLIGYPTSAASTNISIEAKVKYDVYNDEHQYICPGKSVLAKDEWTNIWMPGFVIRCAKKFTNARREYGLVDVRLYGSDTILYLETDIEDSIKIIDNSIKNRLLRYVVKEYDDEIRRLEEEIKDLNLSKIPINNIINIDDTVYDSRWMNILSSLPKPLEISDI